MTKFCSLTSYGAEAWWMRVSEPFLPLNPENPRAVNTK